MFNHYEDMKGKAKCISCDIVGLGVREVIDNIAILLEPIWLPVWL